MEHRILPRRPLGNPRRLWRQTEFRLSTFSVHPDRMRDIPRAMATLKAAGFDLVELGWATHRQAETALKAAGELGIDLLFQDFSVFGGMQENHLDRVVTAETVNALCDRLRTLPRCVGCYVWDEPYVEDQLREARRQVDLFEAAMPDRLPFTVAIPSYNTRYQWPNNEFAAYLDRYARIIDPPVLSLDYYPVGLPQYTDEAQLDDSLFWCDLGQMRVIGRQYDLPLWFYYQGINLYRYRRFHPDMVRMMIYAACLYGVKALQQFTAAGSVIDKNGGEGPFFAAQKQLHREFHALGNTLMALQDQFVFHSDDLLPGHPHRDVAGDDIAKSALLAALLPPRTSAGEFTDTAGNRYLLVLNRDYEIPAAPALPLNRPCRLYTVSPEDGTQQVLCDRTDTLRLQLAPGDAALLRVQNADEAPFTVEYRLEK